MLSLFGSVRSLYRAPEEQGASRAIPYLVLDSYSSTSSGTIEKTSQGLRFTVVNVSISVTVSDDEAAERALSLRLKQKREKYCPVSASLNCPVWLTLEIIPRADQQRGGTQAKGARVMDLTLHHTNSRRVPNQRR